VGSSNPEDVPRLALNRIVSALDDYVDTIQFRSLPLAYQRLAAAEPTGRLSAALGGRERGRFDRIARGLIQGPFANRRTRSADRAGR
jgi:hypothetical protein